MVENQNNNQNQPKRKSGNKIIDTEAIDGVVGGLVGGGAAYYAMDEMKEGQAYKVSKNRINSNRSKIL